MMRGWLVFTVGTHPPAFRVLGIINLDELHQRIFRIDDARITKFSAAQKELALKLLELDLRLEGSINPDGLFIPGEIGGLKEISCDGGTPRLKLGWRERAIPR